MSREATAFVRRVKVGGVSRRAVLDQLARMADKQGRVPPVSLGQIARWTEQSKSTVQRRLVELEGLGVIQRIWNTVGKTKVPDRNSYQVMMPGVEPELRLERGMVNLTTPFGSVTPPGPDHIPMVTRDHTPIVTGDHTTAVELQLEPRTTTSSLPSSTAVEHRGEVVNDLWKTLRLVVLRRWHCGKPRIEMQVEGKKTLVGLGLEKLHLGELVAFHGANDSELAIMAAHYVWPEGWPRTLAWFTSPKYGGSNFHEALSFARQHRRTTSKSEAVALARLIPEVLARIGGTHTGGTHTETVPRPRASGAPAAGPALASRFETDSSGGEGGVYPPLHRNGGAA